MDEVWVLSLDDLEGAKVMFSVELVVEDRSCVDDVLIGVDVLLGARCGSFLIFRRK